MFVVIHLRHTNGGACALCCHSSPQIAPHPRPDGPGPSRHFPYGTTISMPRLERSPPGCSDPCLLAGASGSMVEVRGTFPAEHPEGGSPVVTRATMLRGRKRVQSGGPPGVCFVGRTRLRWTSELRN
jgi:hypothetical protein